MGRWQRRVLAAAEVLSNPVYNEDPNIALEAAVQSAKVSLRSLYRFGHPSALHGHVCMGMFASVKLTRGLSSLHCCQSTIPFLCTFSFFQARIAASEAAEPESMAAGMAEGGGGPAVGFDGSDGFELLGGGGGGDEWMAAGGGGQGEQQQQQTQAAACELTTGGDDFMETDNMFA